MRAKEARASSITRKELPVSVVFHIPNFQARAETLQPVGQGAAKVGTIGSSGREPSKVNPNWSHSACKRESSALQPQTGFLTAHGQNENTV